MNQLIIKITEKSGTDLAILVIRAGASLMMLTHGIPKLLQFFSPEPVAFASVMGMSMTLSLALAVFAEVVCSLLILFGLGTRLAAVPLVITMLTAAFYVHSNDPFSGKEMALLYALVFIALIIKGGGKYAVDNILSRQRKRKLVAA